MRLLCVKSIMTIAITITLCVLTYFYPETYADVFKNVAVMVATFYFAHQNNKREVSNNVGISNDGNLRSNLDADQ